MNIASAAVKIQHKDHPLLGIAFVLMAGSCFVVLDTSVKVLSASISIMLAVWFRYLCQAVGMTLVVLPMRGLKVLRTHHPWLHVARGALMVLSSALSFEGLKYMPVAEITAVYMLTPLMVTLLAALFLGERVNGVRWLLVTGGFAGALLMIRPTDTNIGWAVLFPLSGMAIYAVFQILTSRMARTEDPMVLHMYSGWVGTLVMSAALPWVWQTIPSSAIGGLLLLAGLMGTIGHFLLILAYAKAHSLYRTPCTGGHRTLGGQW